MAPLEGTAFAPAAASEVRGTRATTSAEGKVVTRYLLRWQAWTVRIVAEAPAGVATAQASLDAAVEALPWRSVVRGRHGRFGRRALRSAALACHFQFAYVEPLRFQPAQ